VRSVSHGRAAIPRLLSPCAISASTSQPIHLVSAVILPSRLLDVTLGWGLTAVCCAIVGLAVLRMRDDDFDSPPQAVR
jgi:hypothetical protein